jgi:hypothetical protein
MLRRCMGAIAILLALGGTPALAHNRVHCRDGSVRPRVKDCNRWGGGVWSNRGYGGPPMARCRDGSIDTGSRACRFRGGVRRWI